MFKYFNGLNRVFAQLLLVFSLLFAVCTFADSEQLAQGEIVKGSITVNGSNYNVDWYLPDASANGLVYLQHGFARKSENLRDLATVLMDKGLMVLSVNANMTGGNESLALAVADQLIDNPPSVPGGGLLPSPLILSGHSAGALHVAMIAKRLIERESTVLAGLVLLDPVDANGKFAPAVDSLNSASVTTLSVTANASSCNSSNNTQGDLQRLNDDYVGIKLTDRSKHTDAEGDNVDFWGQLFCGAPRDYNIAALQAFVSAWVSDMATGLYTPAYYPGGAALNELINNDRAITIK